MIVKLEIFPKGEKNKSLKPTPSCRFGPESKLTPGFPNFFDPAWYHLWRLVSENL